MSGPNSYVCDTIPAAKLATDKSEPPPTPPLESPMIHHQPVHREISPSPPPSSPPAGATPRKLCVRHQRMADEGTNLKLQQSLDAMPLEERQAVNAIWSNFSSSSHRRRALILQGLLTMCCFSQLSLLTEQLAHLIRIDPFAVLPRETGLKILGHLDATSLCRAAQVSKKWKSLADDDVLWQGICEQHIGQKCHKCGWGLPVLEKRRRNCLLMGGTSPLGAAQEDQSMLSPGPAPKLRLTRLKRSMSEDEVDVAPPPMKRQRSTQDDPTSAPVESCPSMSSQESPSSVSTALLTSSPHPQPLRRPWKDVYSERMTIERNWRRGRCTIRTLKGHTDGVMCLQFSESLPYPAFPVLISGSYDRTVRVWNMDTGVELHCLRGHTRAVRALQFDDIKLITGSMDHTLKVWDWRRGQCIRTLRGHTDGVVCLNFDDDVLASGSVDTTIKVWNLRTGGAFTLRGHSDWVNAVLLWDANPSSAKTGATNVPLFGASNGTASPLPCASSSSSEIDVGKMLFSASDDGTIKVWDLNQRTCLRTMTGHMGQVQSIRLLAAGECNEADASAAEDTDNASSASTPSTAPVAPDPVSSVSAQPNAPNTRSASEPLSSSLPFLFDKTKQPMLISGSLDNTIKLWDIESGKAVRTLFGHIEGVWAVASDKLRLVSGSHDRTIKVWSREEGKCTSTLVGHQAAVSCLALGEDKIVSGSDDSDIRIWSFAGDA